MLSDILFVLGLILLNGAFSLSEIAVISSKRPRLMQMAGDGSAGAQQVLALAAEPTEFLSAVQVGITTIGVLTGAIGEATIARHLRPALQNLPVLAPYAESLSLGATVVAITYVSLIVGELVPKRLALTNPEKIASIIAKPMRIVATVAKPLVWLLSASTDAALGLLGVRSVARHAVTMEEIKVLIEQGTEQGVLEPSEHDMMTNVLKLDERRVLSVLTPRTEIVFLDLQDSHERNRDRLRQGPHDVLPLCDGGLDHVVGFVRSRRVLEQAMSGQKIELADLAEPPLFVPETMSLMTLLEQFRRSDLPTALVVDEFGEVEGLVSLTDVLAAIVGDLPGEIQDEPTIVRREDGSWLLDGALALSTVARTLRDDSFLGDANVRLYHTLGGMVMFALGRVPRTGDTFERGGYRFEIVDMDGNRVDRVLVTPRGQQAGSG